MTQSEYSYHLQTRPVEPAAAQLSEKLKKRADSEQPKNRCITERNTKVTQQAILELL